jgi:hypothetical protein
MTTPLEEQDMRTIYIDEDRSIVLYKEFVLQRRERRRPSLCPLPSVGEGGRSDATNKNG